MKILKSSNKLSLWIIFFLLLVFIFGRFQKSQGNLINPFIKSGNTGLSAIVNESLRGVEGRFGIVIKNLKTKESFFLNENEKFEPGSLYKLRLMVIVFEQISTGKLREDEYLKEDIARLNNYFSIPEDEAELKTGTIDFTTKSALEQMITISHNYAAMVLTKKTKAEGLVKEVTPKEIADFFEGLYLGKVISGEISKEMLELLSRQKINNRISKLLPQETMVAHKTADLGQFEHDGGIVFVPSGDYIIVLLTESKIPDKTGEKIAEISKKVFDYFNR